MQLDTGTDPCIFCRIIAGEVPAYLIHRDQRVAVFLSLHGHPLIVTKAHVPDIYSLDDDEAAAIMRTAVRLARAVKEGLNCDGVYLTQANEAAAGQDMGHFHLHVYPRWHGDGLAQPDPPRQTDPAAMGRMQAQIRAAFEATVA